MAAARTFVHAGIEPGKEARDCPSLVHMWIRWSFINNPCRDLKETISIVEKIKNKKFGDEDSLFKFVDEEKFQNTELNRWFCNFLKEYDIIDIQPEKSSYSVEAIMNTAIYNMVQNGSNPAVIAKINGTLISTLEKKYYSNGMGIKDIDILVNHEICKNSYYNYI